MKSKKQKTKSFDQAIDQLKNKKDTVKEKRVPRMSYYEFNIHRDKKIIENFLNTINVNCSFLTARDKIATLLILVLKIKISDLTKISVADLKKIKTVMCYEKFELSRIEHKDQRPCVFVLDEQQLTLLKKYEKDFNFLLANREYTDDHLFMNLSKEHLSRTFSKFFFNLSKYKSAFTQ